MSNIVIQQTQTDDGLLFSIESGVDSGISYAWYLDSVLVGTDSTYLLTTSLSGGTIYVDVEQRVDSIWYDGHFYGGQFNGQFLGGTFHYGTLNGVYYPYTGKPKKFIT